MILPLYNGANSSTGAATITLAGGFTGTIQFEVSGDGGNTWASIFGTPSAGGTVVTSATAAGTWTFSVSGYTHIRARASAFASGPLAVTIQASTNAIAAGGISNLGGGAQGQAVICTSTTNCAPDASVLYATGFKGGGGALSPCAAIEAAEAAAPSGLGAVIDAGGLSGNTGAYSGQGFTNVGCGLESNIESGWPLAGSQRIRLGHRRSN